MPVKKTTKKICKCGPPYGYASHVKDGPCRVCWGLKAEKSYRPAPSCWTGAFF